MAEKAQFDNNYEAKARAANQLAAKQNYFMQTRGEWQGTKLAVLNGALYGGMYGGAFGTLAAIQSRQMRLIPRYAAYVAVPYSAFLGISSLYRMDL